MEDYFINREAEVAAFQKALDAIFKKNSRPQVLLWHGASGMGKTWLTSKCLGISQEDERNLFPIYVDCNRANMTLEALFYDIHLSLETDFKKYFEDYGDFLEKVNDIENEVENEVSSNPENALIGPQTSYQVK